MCKSAWIGSNDLSWILLVACSIAKLSISATSNQKVRDVDFEVAIYSLRSIFLWQSNGWSFHLVQSIIP